MSYGQIAAIVEKYVRKWDGRPLGTLDLERARLSPRAGWAPHCERQGIKDPDGLLGAIVANVLREQGLQK